MCDPVESVGLKYYTCFRNNIVFLTQSTYHAMLRKLIPTEKPDCSTRLLQWKKEYIENLSVSF